MWKHIGVRPLPSRQVIPMKDGSPTGTNVWLRGSAPPLSRCCSAERHPSGVRQNGPGPTTPRPPLGTAGCCWYCAGARTAPGCVFPCHALCHALGTQAPAGFGLGAAEVGRVPGLAGRLDATATPRHVRREPIGGAGGGRRLTARSVGDPSAVFRWAD